MSSYNTVAQTRWYAHQAIDAEAGRARLRYITDVPGQQAVYAVKLREARDWLAVPVGNPGPHLAAISAAMSSTPSSVAQDIVAANVAWAENVSPSIEAARLAGKAAVTAAATIAAACTARDASLDALRAI